MNKSTYLILAIISLLISACKKTEPNVPLKVIKEETYTPPGYNPNLFYTKTTIVDFNNSVNDIIIDNTNNSNAFIIGNFTNYNGNIARGIVKFSSSNNSFSNYPNNFNSTTNISAFFQGSDGRHYIGGYIYDQSSMSYRYFGSKLPNSSIISYTSQLSGQVEYITEINSELFIAGYFNQYNFAYCSPLLKVSSGTITSIGTPLPNNVNNGVKNAAYFNSTWYLTQESNALGYIVSSTSGSWTPSAGGGFNSNITDLIISNNRLFCSGNMTYEFSYMNTKNYVNELIGNTWTKVGINNLSGMVNDIEIHNNILFACGNNFIYYLDTSDNRWKSKVNSNVNVGNLTNIKFINGKLYAIENGTRLVQFS